MFSAKIMYEVGLFLRNKYPLSWPRIFLLFTKTPQLRLRLCYNIFLCRKFKYIRQINYLKLKTADLVVLSPRFFSPFLFSCCVMQMNGATEPMNEGQWDEGSFRNRYPITSERGSTPETAVRRK
jgi:hypothetical protein